MAMTYGNAVNIDNRVETRARRLVRGAELDAIAVLLAPLNKAALEVGLLL